MQAIPVSGPRFLSSVIHSTAIHSTLIAAIVVAVAGMMCAPMQGQGAAPATAAQRPLITQAVDESQLTTLTGNTHPLARPENDLGTAPASLSMARMLLVLKRSADQETALRKLLDDQQDKASPNYHQWLTPEQYGQQFGPTDTDLQTITAWLQSHGFEVGSTKGRTVLEFSGTAGQVQEAFHTTIHKYVVKGEQHWANASDPQIPTALTPAVAGIDSLNNFPRRAMNRFVGTYSEKTKSLTTPEPNYTVSCGSGQSCYAVSPYDFATIYDVLPLWNASPAIDGTGETIAIVGRTNINPLDATEFWQIFGLTVPANKLNIILNGPDPGINGDEPEADIDVQWSGAVAPQATIDFVTSASTQTTDGVDLSAVYIVENNLAPVMSESYGLCELGLGTAGNQFYSRLWEQAAAQGTSVFVSSGDNGAAGCDDPGGPAQYGLNVNGIASTPFNAAVGGTDFNQYNKQTTYWNPTNAATTEESAKGYIPETTWNDSCTNALAVTLGYGSTAEQACNNSQMIALGGVNSTGGSGGPSNCVVNTQNVGSCTQGYAKPSWQSGNNVPPDDLRDLPDVSLFASSGFMGSFYVICQQDQTGGACNLNLLLAYGGTSVASPAFAGIMSLVNQKTGTPQGVPGFALYQLVSKQANAFHDVPSGSTIAMPCYSGTPNCTVSTAGDQFGVLSGYNTATGYDLATGLGTVDAANLVNNWTKATFTATTATLKLNNGNAVNVTHGNAVPVSLAINPTAATGNASLLVDVGPGTTTGQAIDLFSLSSGSVSGSTSLLPAGTYNVIAHYGGDGTYGGSYSNSVSVTVSKENSTVDFPGLQLGGVAVTTVNYDDQYTLLAGVQNSQSKSCSPPFGEVTCPTGTLTLTDGGTALGSGTYNLDNTGFVQTASEAFILTGGTHALKAQYGGDTNYNAGSTSVSVKVNPAATTTVAPYVQANDYTSVGLSTQVLDPNAQSNVATPTGQVKFYSNGTLLAGTVSYGYGSGTSMIASMTAAFPGPGTYSITAQYFGDQNYQGSTSQATSATLKYPAPAMTLTPATQTVPYGGTATVTALVDTTNKKVYPTGTITFTDANTGAVISGPTACTQTTDSSGNYACQAATTFTVTSGDGVAAGYSGDANYPSTFDSASINMPDFQITDVSGAVTVTAGQSQSQTIVAGGFSGFNGTISNFTCSGLPAQTTCTFNPTQLTPTGAGNVSTTLTVTTTAVGQSRRAFNGYRAIGWTAAAFVFLFSACLFGIPSSVRRRGMLPTLVVLAVCITLLSCGGGGGGGGVINNPVPSISSLNPSQVAAGSQLQSLTINGSGFMNTSTVTLGGVQQSGIIPSANQITIYPSASQLAATGQLPVVVTNPAPGGGPSSPVNLVVTTGTPTGTFTVTVTATSGALTHTTTFTLTVQ
jgi:subtilase family serine protease